MNRSVITYLITILSLRISMILEKIYLHINIIIHKTYSSSLTTAWAKQEHSTSYQWNINSFQTQMFTHRYSIAYSIKTFIIWGNTSIHSKCTPMSTLQPVLRSNYTNNTLIALSGTFFSQFQNILLSLQILLDK